MKTKARPSAKKRQRSENWLEADKILLKGLVKERFDVIENKKTDTNSNTKKVAAWADLLNSFNCMCTGAQRTISQIKAQWGIIKMCAKKQKAQERKEQMKTGGGPPPTIETPDDNDISFWLPNEFDSDKINQIHYKTADGAITNGDLEIVSVFVEQESSNTNEEDVASPTSSPSKVKQPEKKEEISAVEKVADCEVKCREELHRAQMENEKKIGRNLDLKKIMLLKKTQYYEQKLKNLG